MLLEVSVAAPQILSVQVGGELVRHFVVGDLGRPSSSPVFGVQQARSVKCGSRASEEVKDQRLRPAANDRGQTVPNGVDRFWERKEIALPEEGVHDVGSMGARVVSLVPPYGLQTPDILSRAPMVECVRLWQGRVVPANDDGAIVDVGLHRLAVVAPNALLTVSVDRIDRQNVPKLGDFVAVVSRDAGANANNSSLGLINKQRIELVRSRFAVRGLLTPTPQKQILVVRCLGASRTGPICFAWVDRLQLCLKLLGVTFRLMESVFKNGFE